MLKLWVKISLITMLLSANAYAALQIGSHSFSFLPAAPVGEGNLIIVKLAFNPLNVTEATGGDTVEDVINDFVTSDAENPELEGKPYNYPNPFRLASGTTLAYRMNTGLDMKLMIYNSRGHKVAEQFISKDLERGLGEDYYQVSINKGTFGGYDMPAGIYYFVMVGDGKVMGKGKMAIIP